MYTVQEVVCRFWRENSNLFWTIFKQCARNQGASYQFSNREKRGKRFVTQKCFFVLDIELISRNAHLLTGGLPPVAVTYDDFSVQ